MNRRIVIAIAFGVCLSIAGCKTVSVPAQPTAASMYQNAAVAMNDFSADLLSLHKIEVDLHNGGEVDAATHVKIQNAFLLIDSYGHQLDALISAQAAAPTIAAKVASLTSALAGITNATTALSPTTRTQISNAVQLAQQVLTNVLSAIQISTAEAHFGSSNDRSIGRGGSDSRSEALQPSEVGEGRRGEALGRPDRRGRG